MTERAEPPVPAVTPRTPGGRGGGPLSQPYRWLSIGMFALIFIAAFEVLAVTTIMPLVAAELDGEGLFALAFSVPFAVGVVGLVVSGNWADRSGPLPPLIAAGVLFSVGLVIAGLAPNMEVLVLGRLVHGVGGTAVTVPLYVIVARVYPEHLRARVFAGFAAAWVIPSIVGPAVAGFVAEQVGWRWVFLGVIALVLPAAAMMLRPLLRVHDRVAGDPAVPWSGTRLGWSALAAIGALGVSLAKELDEPWRWVVAVAAIALTAVAVRPLLPAGTLRAVRGMPATVLLRAIVAGEDLPPLTMEDIDRNNAENAARNDGLGKDEVLARLRTGGEAMTTVLRGLRDDDLARSAPFTLFGGEVSVRTLVEQAVLEHTAQHLASLQAAVGTE